MSEPNTTEPTTEPAATQPNTTEPIRLPDDHPLVKAFTAQKNELAQLKQQRDDAENANKSESQKLADRIAELEKANANLAAEKLRATVAAAKGVPAELLSGATEDELNAAADKLLAFKGTAPQLPGNQRPAGPVSQVQGREESPEDLRKRFEESLKR